jgi:hypothetical protein
VQICPAKSSVEYVTAKKEARLKKSIHALHRIYEAIRSASGENEKTSKYGVIAREGLGY